MWTPSVACISPSGLPAPTPDPRVNVFDSRHFYDDSSVQNLFITIFLGSQLFILLISKKGNTRPVRRNAHCVFCAAACLHCAVSAADSTVRAPLPAPFLTPPPPCEMCPPKGVVHGDFPGGTDRGCRSPKFSGIPIRPPLPAPAFLSVGSFLPTPPPPCCAKMVRSKLTAPPPPFSATHEPDHGSSRATRPLTVQRLSPSAAQEPACSLFPRIKDLLLSCISVMFSPHDGGETGISRSSLSLDEVRPPKLDPQSWTPLDPLGPHLKPLFFIAIFP